MNALLISLGAGALIGLIYSLLKVQSPAPPAVALVGLLGMVMGSMLGGVVLHNEASALIRNEEPPQTFADKPQSVPQLIAKQAG